MPPWPAPFKAAVSFTMDNLGEAQDVNRHAWPHSHGTHPSITTSLPRMLGLLDQYHLRATYFVEAWSLGVYPAVVRDLRSRGHEVAWHGYQHEVWSGLSDAQEIQNFEKSFAAARDAEVEYLGFRPPGGKINERTWELLKTNGVRYVSPLGELGVSEQGVAVLPFEWKAVDAYYYMETEKFKEIRRELGDGEGAMGPEEFKAFLMDKVDEVKRTGGFLSVLFHPFLQTSEEKFEVLEHVLGMISEDPEIWSVPCEEVADWVLGHGDEFGLPSRG